MSLYRGSGIRQNSLVPIKRSGNSGEFHYGIISLAARLKTLGKDNEQHTKIKILEPVEGHRI
jgi:hypothetical protein